MEDINITLGDSKRLYKESGEEIWLWYSKSIVYAKHGNKKKAYIYLKKLPRQVSKVAGGVVNDVLKIREQYFRKQKTVANLKQFKKPINKKVSINDDPFLDTSDEDWFNSDEDDNDNDDDGLDCDNIRRLRINPTVSRNDFDENYQPFGLRNHGNTCYQNSSLQMLFSDYEFQRYIARHYNADVDDKLFTNLIASVVFAESPQAGRNALKCFVEKCASENVGGRRRQQYDSYEFMARLIDKIEKENGDELIAFEWETEERKYCTRCKKDYLDDDDTEEQYFLITGGHSLDKKSGRILRTKKFDLPKYGFVKMERNDKCDKCGKKGSLYLYNKVVTFPLTGLIRFDRKSNVKISIPYDIEFRNFYYRLHAVVTHEGYFEEDEEVNFASGHYTAYVNRYRKRKRDNKKERQWYYISDNNVETVGETQFRRAIGEGDGYLDSRAFVVMYKRRNYEK